MDFQRVENFKMEELDFNQFLRMRNQLVIGAENFGGRQFLRLIQIPTMSRNMDEKLKLAHRDVDAVDRPNRRISVNMLRYNVDEPKNWYV